MKPSNRIRPPRRYGIPIPEIEIRLFLNALSLRRVRRARVLHTCQFCTHAVPIGDQCRTTGSRTVHEFCYQAVSRDCAASDSKREQMRRPLV